MDGWESHFDSFPSPGLSRHEATAVPHPFGRGEFKEIAMKAVIPKIVLDAMVNKPGNESSWSTSAGATWEGGGASRQTYKSIRMGGVKKKNSCVEGKIKPKVSCRGRALKMRAEKSRMPRPGAEQPRKEQVGFRRSSVPFSNHGGESSRSKEGELPELSQRRSRKDDRIYEASEPLLVQTHHSTQEDWDSYNSKWPSLKAANNLSCFSDTGSSKAPSENSLHFSPPPPSTTNEESISTSSLVANNQPVNDSLEKNRRLWVPIDRKGEDIESEWYEESWMPDTIPKDTIIVGITHSQDDWIPAPVIEEVDSGIEPCQDTGKRPLTEEEEVPTTDQFQDACFPSNADDVDTVTEALPNEENTESTSTNGVPTPTEEKGVLKAVSELTSKEKESVVELSEDVSIPIAKEEVTEVIDNPLKTGEGLVNEQVQDISTSAEDASIVNEVPSNEQYSDIIESTPTNEVPASTEENGQSVETVVELSKNVTASEGIVSPLKTEEGPINEQACDHIEEDTTMIMISHEAKVDEQPQETAVPVGSVTEECNDINVASELEDGFEVNSQVEGVPTTMKDEIEKQHQGNLHVPYSVDIVPTSIEIDETPLGSPTTTAHDEGDSIIVNGGVPLIANGLRIEAEEIDDPISNNTILHVVEHEIKECSSDSVTPIEVAEVKESHTSNEKDLQSVGITAAADDKYSIPAEYSQECTEDAKIDESDNVVEERPSSVSKENEDGENTNEDIPIVSESDVNKSGFGNILQEDSKSINVEDGGVIFDPLSFQVNDKLESGPNKDTGCKQMDKQVMLEELPVGDTENFELQIDNDEEKTTMSHNEQVFLPQEQNVFTNMEINNAHGDDAIVEPQSKEDKQPVHMSLFDNPPNNPIAIHNTGTAEQERPIAKDISNGIQTADVESLESKDTCSISTPAIVCAAGPNQEESLDWSLDNHSLCFGNLPSYVTEKELEQMIEPFGSISHCKVLRQGHDNGTSESISTVVAYVRMDKKSACNWVISCFHGSPYDDSPLHIQCNYAVATGEVTENTIENFDI